MSWTDDEIDKLFKDKAENMSFEYKSAYWDEFNAALPVAISEVADIKVADNEIDNVYREGVKDLSFKYKDEYWREMVAMLPQRRQPDFLWFATAILFLGLLTTSLFVGQLRGNNLSTSSNVETENGSGNIENSALISSTKNEVKSEQADIENNNGAVTSIDESATNNGAVLRSNFLHTPSQVLQNGNHLSVNELSGNESGTNELLEVRNNETVHTLDLFDNQSVKSSGTDEIPLIVDNSLNNQYSNSNNLAVDQSINEPLKNYDQEDRIDNLATKPLEYSIVSGSILNLQDQVLMPDFKLPGGSSFYVELNGALSQSLITPSDKLSYSGGIGIGGQFQKGRLTFTTGINGIWAFHDDIVLNRQAKVYGFGSNVYNYTVKYNHIYSLEGVLSAGYRFGKHQITVGVRPSFAFSSKVGFTLLGEEVDSERKVVYGHMDGIQRLGLKPMIGYSVDLPSNLTIGLNIGTQLMTSVNEDFIDGKNNTLPIDGQLYIRKRLRFRR